MQLHPIRASHSAPTGVDTTLLTNVTRAALGMPEINRKDVSIHPHKRDNYGRAFAYPISEAPNDANKGILGKRTRKLQARRQNRDIAVAEANRKSKGANAEKANRIPGSMTK